MRWYVICNGRKFTVCCHLHNEPPLRISKEFQIGHNFFVLEYSTLADGKLSLKMTKKPTTSDQLLPKYSLKMHVRQVSASVNWTKQRKIMPQVSGDLWGPLSLDPLVMLAR